MTIVTVSLNEEEEKAFKDYADTHGVELFTLLKNSLIEKMENIPRKKLSKNLDFNLMKRYNSM